MSNIVGITIFFPGRPDKIEVEGDDVITDASGARLSLEEARDAVLLQDTPFVTVHTKMQRVFREPYWEPGDAVLPEEMRPPPEWRETRATPRRFTVSIPTKGAVVGVEFDEEMPDE